MHTFGVKGDQGPIHSIKTEVWRTLVAKPEEEHEFGPKTFLMRTGQGDTHGTSKNVAFERNESQPCLRAKPRVTARVPHTGAARTDSLKPNSLKQHMQMPTWMPSYYFGALGLDLGRGPAEPFHGGPVPWTWGAGWARHEKF